MKNLYSKNIKTPVGKLTLVAHDDALVAVLWEKEKRGRVKIGSHFPVKKHAILDETERQIVEYFRGERMTFNIRLKFKGTEFQRKVWKELQRIPYGTTPSYSALAKKIGSPKAYRAVGSANGKNPLSIIVPCHRVIGKDKRLTGFAGGIENKSYLVALEARIKLVEGVATPV
jgi:methylated-DNA-[protein]-cysteine S-methyltransferase